MNKMVKRWCGPLLRSALQAMPAVVVTGARQTGKTTLVRELLNEKKRSYFSFDELDVLEQARSDPETLITQTPLTLDEVQREPDILLVIKAGIDRKRKNGAYILTGSANLALMHTVSESLAGRSLYLELPPFCPCEWCGTYSGPQPIDLLFQEGFEPDAWPDGRENWQNWLLNGGMPPAILQNSAKSRSLWFSGYVQTYLERDLRQLSDVASLPDFQKVMRLAANRTARLLNQSDIARDAALPQPTCHRYLNLLETGYQITRLAPYHTNPTTSLVKAKKIMFNDCGIAAWLAGIDSEKVLEKRIDRGFWLEQAVFQTLQTWRSLDPVNRRISFWRDRRGNEVDFILEDRDRAVALEIKLGRRVSQADRKGIEAFRNAAPGGRTIRGVVLHTGDTKRIFGDNCYALPLGWMFPD